MPVGEYQVLAYDVEWNWDISPGGPAARGVVSVTNGSSTGIIVVLQVIISVTLNVHVCISCPSDVASQGFIWFGGGAS